MAKQTFKTELSEFVAFAIQRLHGQGQFEVRDRIAKGFLYTIIRALSQRKCSRPRYARPGLRGWVEWKARGVPKFVLDEQRPDSRGHFASADAESW